MPKTGGSVVAPVGLFKKRPSDRLDTMPQRSPTPLLQSHLPGQTPTRGKVRDVYDFGDRLLFVATDRISAFDWVLPTGIPDKGRVLTQISQFWFRRLPVRRKLSTTVLSTSGVTMFAACAVFATYDLPGRPGAPGARRHPAG